MKQLLLIILLLPLLSYAHPGVGIVKDSRGNIFYTDLTHVWKITNNKKTIVVPDVHTHELYIDDKDKLYGEGGYYDSPTEKFYHYLWVYTPKGKFDTVVGIKQNFVHHNFSLARDRQGNEYYLKRFFSPFTDTNHIYKKTAAGVETVLAKGNFKKVNWLHPQHDGSVLYSDSNSIYRVDTTGNIRLVKDSVASIKPLFPFSSGIMIWGLWEDKDQNVYAAVFSDQRVKKIDARGNITTVHQSDGSWAPLHGVFDNEGNLWVLEGSEKNEVRVVKAALTSATTTTSKKWRGNTLKYILIAGTIAGLALVLFRFRSLIK